MASALRLWLTALREKTVARRLEGQIDGDADKDAARDTGASVKLKAAVGRSDVDDTKRLDGLASPKTEDASEIDEGERRRMGSPAVDVPEHDISSKATVQLRGEHSDAAVVVPPGEHNLPPERVDKDQLLRSGNEVETDNGAPLADVGAAAEQTEIRTALSSAEGKGETDSAAATGQYRGRSDVPTAAVVDARPEAGPTGILPSASGTEAGIRASCDSAVEANVCGDGEPVEVGAANDELAAEKPDGVASEMSVEESRPCPRCGIRCPPDQVERVFGYRTMRWVAAGRETSAVRRQSYCRRCRSEHAVEMRDPAESDGRPAVGGPSDREFTRTTKTSDPLVHGAKGSTLPTDEQSIGATEEAPHVLANRALGDNESDRFLEEAVPDVGEDLPAGSVKGETEAATPEVSDISAASEEARARKEESAGVDKERCADEHEPGEKREIDTAAGTGKPAKPDAETAGADILGRIGKGTAGSRSEEDTRRRLEVSGGVVEDVETGTADLDARKGTEDLDPLQTSPGEARDRETPIERSSGNGVILDAGGAAERGGPTSAGEPTVTATPDLDGSVLPAGTQKDDHRPAPLYRAPAATPPPRRRPTQSPTKRESASSASTRTRPAPIDVRVTFQRGGYCVVSLLPHRLPGMPDELVVSSVGGNVELLALEGEWYQDVAPENLAELLRTGSVWKDSDTGREWLLSGREVYVLAHGTTHRGFASYPRLVIGREHVVLCATTQLDSVEDALRAAGCSGWTQFGEDDGAPSGWRILRDVVPHKPVPLRSDGDVFNIIRPLPEIEIALEGGIRLAYNTWLLGYPPVIRVYGDPDHINTVLIDSQKATGSNEDGYAAPGWNAEGDHQVWCSSTTKTYSLLRSEANWTYWPAYSFALHGAHGHEFEFCGPLVRPVTKGGPSVEQQRVVQVPPANPVLLGACPGDVFFAHPRLDLHCAKCLGLPEFDPVWALPSRPLHCDKRRSHILLIGGPTGAATNSSGEPSSDRRDIERWCRLILDASRKGLTVEPASPAARNLWREHRRLARSIWKSLR